MSHDTIATRRTVLDMSTTLFYILLAIGALATAPLARLVPTGRSTMALPIALFMAVIFSVIAGTLAAEGFEGHSAGALLTALGLTPLYIVFVNRFGSDDGPSGWHPSDSGSWDSGCGDSGGGDGGGGCD